MARLGNRLLEPLRGTLRRASRESGLDRGERRAIRSALRDDRELAKIRDGLAEEQPLQFGVLDAAEDGGGRRRVMAWLWENREALITLVMKFFG